MKAVINELARLKNDKAVVDISDRKPADSPFEGDYEHATVTGITFNESRFNISLSVVIGGVFHVPEQREGLPSEIPTRAFRNVAIVVDGELVCESLHVVGCKRQDGDHKKRTVKLAGLDILERGDDADSPEHYFANYCSLQLFKAKKKVLDYFYEPFATERKSEFARLYGEENAAYLKSLGLTESGYSPVVPYVADKTPHPELVTKIKGFSIPSFDAYSKKAAEGKKLNDGDQVLDEYYSRIRRTDLSHDRRELESSLDIIKNHIDDLTWLCAMARYSMFATGPIAAEDVTLGKRVFACSIERKN